MRTKRLHARFRVFVSAYQWHGDSNINVPIDNTLLNNARASWPFWRYDVLANHQNESLAVKMAVSTPRRAKERARFLADFAVTAKET
jgi:hypothetical protein